MAEGMWRGISHDPREKRVLLHNILDAAYVESEFFALDIGHILDDAYEERGALPRACRGVVIQASLQIVFEDGNRSIGEEDHADLPPLSPYRDLAGRKIHIIAIKRCKLGETHTGTKECMKDCTIALSTECFGIGSL